MSGGAYQGDGTLCLVSFDAGTCCGTGGTFVDWTDNSAWCPNGVPEYGEVVSFGGVCTPIVKSQSVVFLQNDDVGSHEIRIETNADVSLRGAGSLDTCQLDVRGELEVTEDTTLATALLRIDQTEGIDLSVGSNASVVVGDVLDALPGQLVIQSGEMVIDLAASKEVPIPQATIAAPIIINDTLVLEDEILDGVGVTNCLGGLACSEDAIIRAHVRNAAGALTCERLRIFDTALPTKLDGTLEIIVDPADLNVIELGVPASFIEFFDFDTYPSLGRFPTVRVLDATTMQPLSPNSERTIALLYSGTGVSLAVVTTPRTVVFTSPATFDELEVSDLSMNDQLVLGTHGTNADVDAWVMDLVRWQDDLPQLVSPRPMLQIERACARRCAAA
ncbi:MAG: hypothetical protein AAF432_11215 [Planctomycetota bacterium]